MLILQPVSMPTLFIHNVRDDGNSQVMKYALSGEEWPRDGVARL
jgi:hypothetical protein